MDAAEPGGQGECGSTATARGTGLEPLGQALARQRRGGAAERRGELGDPVPGARCGSLARKWRQMRRFYLFIYLNLFYLFIFGCVGSSLLSAGFL